MSGRRLLPVCIAVVAGFVFEHPECANAGSDAAVRPNFILFIADDMAWDDNGAYGHPHIQTPNIDRLAREGMRFDNAFLTCSSCSPSRSSLITGRYPHNTGARQLHQPLPAGQVTFIEQLKAGGYYTAAAGKWHLGEATQGKFDVIETRLNHWVATLEARPPDKPFFMWFAFSDPHRSYQKGILPKPHKKQDVTVPPYLPDVPETREDLALYYDEITRLDGVVGRVLEKLQDQNAWQNTAVIFLSDNGRPFPRCKTTVYDSGIKTPFVVKWPGRVRPGSTCDSLVSSIDIAPTILELAGLGQSETFQGRSFAGLLDNPNGEVHEFIFAEHNWHDFDDHQRAVRSKRFKYILNEFTDIPQTPPADAVRSITFQAMLRLQSAGMLSPLQRTCFTVPRPKEELYDLLADPHELNNVAADSQYSDTLRQMRRVLHEWKRETGDRVPATRRPDEFHRETGERLARFRRPK